MPLRRRPCRSRGKNHAPAQAQLCVLLIRCLTAPPRLSARVIVIQEAGEGSCKCRSRIGDSDAVVKIDVGHGVPEFFEAPKPNSTFHTSLVLCRAGLSRIGASVRAVSVLHGFEPNRPRTTPTLGLATLSSAFVGSDGFGNVLEAYPIAGSTSAALALVNNSYFTLALSITPGAVGPVVVSFNVGKGGNSDPRGFSVRTSLDGFASDVLSQTLPSGANQAPAPQSFGLNLTGETAVTLRFYVWSPGTNNSLDFRNLQVAGPLSATPLPPSWSLALIGLAAASLYWVWRRRAASVN
jgi:hypothetical protein